MARWQKHHEGPMWRVAILNRMSGHTTYYGPYSLESTAKGVLTREVDSWWNKSREVPNIGHLESTETEWRRVDE